MTSDFFFSIATFSMLVCSSGMLIVIGWTRGTVIQQKLNARRKGVSEIHYLCPCCSGDLTVGMKMMRGTEHVYNSAGNNVTFECSGCGTLQKWDIGGAKFAPVWWRKSESKNINNAIEQSVKKRSA